MKVRTSAFDRRALAARASIIVSFSFVLLMSVFAAPAGALTRSQVLSRAMSWVKHRVPYSQHSHRSGYRRDCSGFVSMAWNLGRSYTTRTISSRAVRVAMSTLRPGDAVLVRGRHVSIFGGWVNKRRGLYVALEETHPGDHARKHVRRIPRRAVGLRRRGIVNRARVFVATRRIPATTVAHPILTVVIPPPPASELATATLGLISVDTSASVLATVPPSTEATVASELASGVVGPPLGSMETTPMTPTVDTTTTTTSLIYSPTNALLSGAVAGIQP